MGLGLLLLACRACCGVRSPRSLRSVEHLELTRADPGVPPASDLLEEMTLELNALYGAADRLQRPALDLDELRPPTGVFLVGRLGAEVVAGGGLRRLDRRVGEVKRMFVRPRWRGRGVAASLLSGLEEEGSRLGHRVLRLDTGPRQVHAKRLYLGAGYRQVPAYNDNPYADFWAEKALPPPLH